MRSPDPELTPGRARAALVECLRILAARGRALHEQSAEPEAGDREEQTIHQSTRTLHFVEPGHEH
jgi:hypothetical protein